MQPFEAYLPMEVESLFPCINSPVRLLSPVFMSSMSKIIAFGPYALGFLLLFVCLGAVLYGKVSVCDTILTPGVVGVDCFPLAIR